MAADEALRLRKSSSGSSSQQQPTTATAMTTRRRSTPSAKKKSSTTTPAAGRQTEAIVREYELCLEQVRTWLVEAEQELHAMEASEDEAAAAGSAAREPGGGDDDDEAAAMVADEDRLDAVKRRFKEHEQFMHSLTESQDSVARVLHRGHQMSEKFADQPAIAETILVQLGAVNERWERIRCAFFWNKKNARDS